MPYAFGAGGSIRSLVPFDVQVYEAGATEYTLSFANVELTPEGGETQKCRLGNGLQPFTPCRFWIDRIRPAAADTNLPPVVIVASKPGYLTEQRVELPRAPACETCPPQWIDLTLRRVP